MRQHHAECADCGWIGGPYRSQAQADYAYALHSCEHQRELQARAQRVAARQAASGPVRDCTCPQTSHTHGTRNAYVVDKCRCRPCRDAAVAYEQRRTKLHAYGRFDRLVDAEPVRAHVRALQEQGMGWKRVAAVAGVNTSVIWKLLYGAPARNMGPSKRVTRATAERILAARLDLSAGAVVDSTGTRRRLQALATLGYSVTHVADRIGRDRQCLDHILAGERNTTRSTADAVRAAYDELWATPYAPTGHHDKAAASRVRGAAARRGWAPPLAWDDDTIDDPNATPDLGDVARHGNGVPDRLAAAVEDVEHLLDGGTAPAEIPARLGYRNAVNLATVLYRADRHDLARRLVARKADAA